MGRLFIALIFFWGGKVAFIFFSVMDNVGGIVIGLVIFSILVGAGFLLKDRVTACRMSQEDVHIAVFGNTRTSMREPLTSHGAAPPVSVVINATTSEPSTDASVMPVLQLPPPVCASSSLLHDDATEHDEEARPAKLIE